MIERSVVAPPGVAPPAGQYSHGVVVEGAARMLYTAGQVPLDGAGNLVGLGDVTAQAEQVFENLRMVVEAAGGRMADIVKTMVFLVDPDHIGPFGQVRSRHFPTDPPANSLLVVSGLAAPEFLVEVEAVVPLPLSHG